MDDFQLLIFCVTLQVNTVARDVDVSDRDGQLFVAAFILGFEAAINLWTLVDGSWDRIVEFKCPPVITRLLVVVDEDAVVLVAVANSTGGKAKRKAVVWRRGRQNSGSLRTLREGFATPGDFADALARP